MFAMFCVRALTSFSYYITIGWCGEGGMVWVDWDVLAWSGVVRDWPSRSYQNPCRRFRQVY
jgi:hypothetical protein